MKKHSGFTLAETLIGLIIVVVIAAVGYFSWQRHESDKPSPTKAANSYAITNDCAAGYQRVLSGDKKFSACFPDGWQLTRDTSSDLLIIIGEKQPVAQANGSVRVTNTPSFGSDGGVVFAIFTETNNPCPDLCHGTASEFGLKNFGITGNKYSYRYSKDTTGAGLGGRTAGDREYTYVFKLPDGRYLRAWYQVYASDPSNHVAQVDDIIASLRLESN